MSGAATHDDDGLTKVFDIPLRADVEVSFLGTVVGRSESADRDGDSYLVEFRRPDGGKGRMWLPDFFVFQCGDEVAE